MKYVEFGVIMHVTDDVLASIILGHSGISKSHAPKARLNSHASFMGT